MESDDLFVVLWDDGEGGKYEQPYSEYSNAVEFARDLVESMADGVSIFDCQTTEYLQQDMW
jgi:hypothetical protein